MAKDPTPRADGLQAMREARYGHLQATAEPAQPVKAKPRKLIPYAGQPKGDTGRTPKAPVDQSPEAVTAAVQLAFRAVAQDRDGHAPEWWVAS